MKLYPCGEKVLFALSKYFIVEGWYIQPSLFILRDGSDIQRLHARKEVPSVVFAVD